ncbi:MAG: FAD-binding protein [Actinobacteria bacterium]|nr:FAD-binding protein [Actinomycetota bacterium]
MADDTRLPRAPEPVHDPDGPPAGTYETDVVVLGAGVAGLAAAASLGDVGARVVVVDKGRPGPSGSSPWAQGGVAAAVGPNDTPELHAADTTRAGDGLCDPAAVAVLTSEGPGAIARLVERGARFDHAPDGSLHLAREGGQRIARSVHRADATGAEMVRALRGAVTSLVERLPGIAVAVAGGPSRVTGMWVLTADGLALVRARAVLLATGGCGGLFAATTNPDHATADGVALAWRAGAAVRDLEFVQFHPTALAPGGTIGARRPLLTEALRGAGATLHDRDGERFLLGLHPDAELAPRHVVAKSILSQPDGIAYLDATRLGERRLREEFPTALRGAEEHGIDLTTERAPVSPAAHYQVGGIRTDLDGRSSLDGLWAAGEVASTGAHGANRMAGNSLLEALVFGKRAAASMGDVLDRSPGPAGDPPELHGDVPDPADLADLRGRLRRAMWQGCGPVRDAGSLRDAAGSIAEVAREVGAPSPDPVHIELVHAARAAGLLIRAAALRTETRGGHVRDDHPDRAPSWAGVHLELLRS